MTDEQIIKALKCCGNWESDESCDECPENTYGFGCAQKMAKHSLDLINRQKAEIERLQIKNKTLTEITKNYDWKFEKAKSEAIKEFADKGELIHDVHLIIDHVKKEMVGDDK